MGALVKVAQFGDALLFGGRISKSLNMVTENMRGGWMRIHESYTGAWQRNDEINFSSASTFHADFACKTLIARDVAKLRLKLVERDKDGVWSETNNPAFSPVLRKPNPFQTRNQFWESWILSKLSRGNTYVLKQYDNRNVVVAMFVLNPDRVWPLVADDGSVFYRLSVDKLSGLPEEVIVPARNIIHDRMNCLFHPLVGVPPIYACALAAIHGLNIQNQSARLFQNNSSPGGVLSGPGHIPDDVAKRVKEYWEQSFSGRNVGRVAILGDGLKYEKMSFTAVEGQLIEQLKLTAEIVCSTYHVPPYKVGIGEFPPYTNVQSANVEYYSQGLQSLIEDAEECLDEGLGIGWGVGLGTEFDVDNLLRMDSVTQMDVLEKAKGILTLDERRKKIEHPSIIGGDTVYLQQQDHSIAAIAARDAMLIQQAKNYAQGLAELPEPQSDDDPPSDEDISASKALLAWEMADLTLDLPEIESAAAA